MAFRPLVLALVAAAALVAAEPEEQAVRALVDRYAAARDTAEPDPAAIRALFTEDADQLVSSGEWRRGREALVPGMMRSSQTNSGDRTIAVETVRFVRPDAAIADARYVIAARDGAPERNMWSTFFVVRTDGGWRISAIRNMKPAP
ncbi:MAG: SgcJ/EcaC family oxidoreductase [Acidobacteria bacterium]|nr:SgcJ/EcaC family oxidoreductase [Acidobacteriota bacterium]